MSAGFHANMSLFSWRNLTSANSYLGSSWVPTWVTLARSSASRLTVFVRFSSGVKLILVVFGAGRPESLADFSSSRKGGDDGVHQVAALSIALVGFLVVSAKHDDP